MRRRIHLPLLLVSVAAWYFCARPEARPQTPPAAAAIVWRSDYQQARKEAQEKKLPLILDFCMQGCIPCRRLEETTFRDPRVLAIVGEKFVALKVEQERDPNLVKALRIHGFPTIVLAGPDGSILNTLEGYQEAPALIHALQRAIAGTTNPEWMLRDFQLASKLLTSGEYARAIAILRNIVEDGGTRSVQVDAQKQHATLERKVQSRIAEAKQLADAGQSTQGLQMLTETVRDFAGLQACREAADFMTRIAQNPDIRNQQRVRRAQELLVQAKDYYKTKEYFLSLDRCEVLMSAYGDLSEGQEANQLAAEIKDNPDVLQSACDNLSDRLGNMYLILADSLLKKGQRAQAMTYLQRVIAAFPGTRQAESAQIRLGQLQGTPTMRVEFQRPNEE